MRQARARRLAVRSLARSLAPHLADQALACAIVGLALAAPAVLGLIPFKVRLVLEHLDERHLSPIGAPRPGCLFVATHEGPGFYRVCRELFIMIFSSFFFVFFSILFLVPHLALLDNLTFENRFCSMSLSGGSQVDG